MALTFNQDRSDTIAAAATAMSEAGIGIIRLSGDRAIEIGSEIYINGKKEHSLSSHASGTIRFGYIVDGDTLIDEVMVSVMRSPHSYTTEDTVEINTHGGIYIMHRVLDLVLKKGARMAEPGEFTRRAFLGGRIDLARAEAVMDLIGSRNEFARKNSLAQLRGAVSDIVRDLRARILYEIAFIESALDDPDSYDLEGYPERLDGVCLEVTTRLRELTDHADEGRLLQDGIPTVIVGKPNAGKSSLMNHMAGEDLAIVTDVAGTTRDTLRESVRLSGILLNLTDTAGIRDTRDKVEKIGIQRTMEAVEKAQLILFLIDASTPVTSEDREIAQVLTGRMKEGASCIVLLNKNDLEVLTKEEDVRALFPEDCLPAFLSCSLATGQGLEGLSRLVEELFHTGEIMQREEVYLTNLRHKEAAREALEAMELVRRSIEDGMSEDFFSIDLMTAYTALGRILGEAVEDDLVEEIFSRFCLGK